MGASFGFRFQPTHARESARWPVEQPMEGLLQWDGRALPPIPVQMANFSAGGVAVWLTPQLDLPPGGHGVLITNAPGHGCGYRPVKVCWQVKGACRSLVGLAFESAPPPQPASPQLRISR